MVHQNIISSLLFMLWTVIVKCHDVSICVDLCPACFTQRMQNCPPLPDCELKVRDPGCGCCFTCAAGAGDRCGINKPRCGPGLKCLAVGSESNLIAILENRGVCQVDPAHQETTEKASRLRLIHTRHVKRRRRKKHRRFPRHPHRGLLSPLNHDGPCSRHYEEMMTSCITMAHKVWLPACDSRGYYAAKQCMSSNGLERGKCWCVDETGIALEDTPYTRDSITCHR
ncbi:insulin-like growth factor-binding protein 5 [Ciona intestinalis]